MRCEPGLDVALRDIVTVPYVGRRLVGRVVAMSEAPGRTPSATVDAIKDGAHIDITVPLDCVSVLRMDERNRLWRDG